jgi:hypothetical protein
MNKFTRIERDALGRMLTAHLQDPDLVANVLTSLVIKSRTFSEDALNKAMCCGFYLDFENIDLPVEFRNLPRFAVQARHRGLPFGADFIFFLNQQNQVFLEATFYGCSIAIKDVVSDEHEFSFRQKGAKQIKPARMKSP